MKTARGPGNLELRDVDKPKPTKNQVLVEVTAAGLCGTDLHIKHDQTHYAPPVILGHEYSGTVVAIGEDVKSIKVGDLVTSPATAYCGQCHQCKTGHMNRCTAEDRRVLGVARANGAFAKYLVAPEYIIHKIPKGVTMEEAALAEPVACVVHGVLETTPITAGDTVVIQGPGTMGLLAIQVARAMGASKVIITGVTADRSRLDVAKKLGANLAIDVQETSDVLDIVQSETDGLGADVVIEASGAGPARAQALEFVKVAGHVGLVGVQGKDTTLPLDRVLEKELTMTGFWGTLPSSWVATLRLLSSGLVDVKPLITHRIGLSEWERGFELMESQKAIKVLFTDLE
ncbi:MAG: alcohol dehydrogenase catalytic domain-containing protein [Candidatus Thorarchaeota archaeon]